MDVPEATRERLLAELQGQEHVIWDWNGTLLDDVEHAVTTVNHLLREHDLPLMTRERYRETFGFPVRTYYDGLGFDYARESFASLCERFVSRFMDGMREVPLVATTAAVVRTLHARGVRQSILSATDQTNLDASIDHFGLRDYFSLVYGVDNKFANSKLERGRELIHASNLAPERTTIIGDTLHDLEVAEALGINALLVSHGHQTAERLRAAHSRVI